MRGRGSGLWYIRIPVRRSGQPQKVDGQKMTNLRLNSHHHLHRFCKSVTLVSILYIINIYFICLIQCIKVNLYTKLEPAVMIAAARASESPYILVYTRGVRGTGLVRYGNPIHTAVY